MDFQLFLEEMAAPIHKVLSTLKKYHGVFNFNSVAKAKSMNNPLLSLDFYHFLRELEKF